MATLRKITLNWEIRTGAITCDTGYIKRQELCDVDLYVTVDGTAYALDTSWALNLSVKPALLGDNAALVAVTTWTASATTGLYQATAQTIGGTALDTYLAANNSDTTDDEGNKLVDLDVYYTVSMAMKAKSDTVTVICKPDVGRTDDTVPATIVARNDFLVSNGTGLLVNVAAGYAANGAFVAAQASLAITNATNYIEITAAGVASVNTTAFTAGSYPLATVVASAGAITANTDLRAWITPKPATGGGTVTSVAQSFTGGLISVAGSPITASGTLALTVAGTSGGIPYFSSGTTWATSAARAASALVVGGGAGAAPASVTTGANVLTALGVAVGTDGAFITRGGNAGTPSAIVLTNASGTASININGTVGATTPSTVAGTTGTFSGALEGASVSATGGLNLVGNITPSASFPFLSGYGLFGGVGTGVKFISDSVYTGVGNKVTGAGEVSLLLFSNNTAQVELTHAGVLACGAVTATTLTASATTSLLLGTAGSAVGNVGFRNATSGTTTLAPATGALGTQTVTLPLTGTLAISSGAQTFTGVQSMTSPDITTSITTPSTTFALVNATATTVNFAGAATTIAMGAATGTTTLGNNLALTTAGVASNSAVLASGALYTGGTGTTTFPAILHQPTGATAATAWSSGANSGTAFGCNEATGFLGNFADYRIAGVRHFALGTDGSGNSRLYWGSGGQYIQIVSSTFSCSGGFSVGGGTLATTGGNGITSSGTLAVTGATSLGGAAAAATTATRLTKLTSSIADNTATACLTVTIPNAAHAASLRVRLLGRLGAGGAIGADEATGAVTYDFAIARTAGVNAVVNASPAFGSAASSVAGATTATVTAAASAISGAVGASNTFTVNVTIAKGGGSSANHTCTIVAEVLNANVTGISIA